MKLFTNGKIFTQFRFEKEADFEREVVLNHKQFFGAGSIYIDVKKKIQGNALGNSIPDGFLFDLSDKENPEFYIVEVELASHDFYRHIFPQITKFFGFFKNPKNQNELIERIFSIVNEDATLRAQFKNYLGDKEIYKFLKDTIEISQNILLVIDGEKKELPEIIETYTDTWGKMVTLIELKKYHFNGEIIYTMNPDFENIEFADITSGAEEEEDVPAAADIVYTEEYHLEGVSETVKTIYSTIKNALLEFEPTLIFNPQKHYLSIKAKRNVAFFKIRRKKIALVVKNPEEDTRQKILHNKIKSLVPSIQKFYNGLSCAVMIESPDNVGEVIALLKEIIIRTNGQL